MAGFGYNANIDTNNMEFSNDLGLTFGAVFDEQQQSFGKLNEGNTSAASYPFFTADEAIDTTTGQFNLADQSLFSLPSAESSFNMPQDLALDNTLGGASAWDAQLNSTVLNNFTYDTMYQPVNDMGKRPLQLDVQDFPQSKRHESYSSTFSPFVASPSASASMTTSSWTLDSQPTPASSSAVETGLSDEAADVCALWFSKYAILPSDRHIDSLSQLTGESSNAIRSWFGRLMKQGMAGHDSAYKSQTSFSQQQESLLTMPTQNHTIPETTVNQDTTSTSPPARGGKKGCTPTEDPELLRHDPSKIYQCTRKCGKRYTRKCDWKRNEEESYPSKSWLCSLCVSQGVNDKLKPCFRRYHFSQHFRNIHPGLNSAEYEASSLQHSDTAFPRRCGFCTHRFASRQDRIDHIADHFKKGKSMLEWVDHEDESQGDDNTDDDNDDHRPDGGDSSNGNSPSSKRPGSGSQGGRGPKQSGNGGSGDGGHGSFSGFGQFQLAGLTDQDLAALEFLGGEPNKHSPGLSWSQLLDSDSRELSPGTDVSDSCTGPAYIDKPCVPRVEPNEERPNQRQRSWNSEAAGSDQTLLAGNAITRALSDPVLSIFDIDNQQSRKTITLENATATEDREHGALQSRYVECLDTMNTTSQDGSRVYQTETSGVLHAVSTANIQKRIALDVFPGTSTDNLDLSDPGTDDGIPPLIVPSINQSVEEARGVANSSSLQTVTEVLDQISQQLDLRKSSNQTIPVIDSLHRSVSERVLSVSERVLSSSPSTPSPQDISRLGTPGADWREITSPAATMLNKFQSFKSVKLLGTGGFSTVDEVIDRETSLRVSRKTLKNRESSAFEELRNEVNVLKKLRHPHIVRFLGAYQKDDKVSILLSPVAETTLAVWLKKSSIEKPIGLSDTIVKMLGCLSSSIRYLHEQRPVVIHMDIKPQNVLVTLNDGQNPHVFLSDFGISTSEEQSGGSSKPLTRQYCAPEVSSGLAREQAADIWSLGCVFVEMLAVAFNEEDSQWNSFLSEFSGRQGKYYWQQVPRLHEHLSGFIERSTNTTSTNAVRTVKSMVNADPHKRPTAATLTMVFSPASCCLNWANDNAAYPGPQEELAQVEMLAREDGVDGLSQYNHVCRSCADHNKTDTFANAKKWLDECIHDHEACVWNNGTRLLPRRLVDLRPAGLTESIRVINSADLDNTDQTDYVAISHVWSAADLTLSQDNRDLLQMSISRTSLSPTLNEAFQAAERIGFRYVWQDSLCVQQDSDQDKQLECSNMASIYRNATLTIVGNSSLPETPTTTTTTTTTWDTRLWTLQERLLSRRLLHLTGEQLYWECNGLKASETFPSGLPSLVWEKAHTKAAPSSSSSPSLPSPPNPSSPDMMKPSNPQPHLLRNCQWLRKQGDGIRDSMPSQMKLALLDGEHFGG